MDVDMAGPASEDAADLMPHPLALEFLVAWRRPAGPEDIIVPHRPALKKRSF
jgi:hypothetical protein